MKTKTKRRRRRKGRNERVGDNGFPGRAQRVSHIHALWPTPLTLPGLVVFHRATLPRSNHTQGGLVRRV